MEANPGMAEIRELADKDFKADVMNIYKERKKEWNKYFCLLCALSFHFLGNILGGKSFSF